MVSHYILGRRGEARTALDDVKPPRMLGERPGPAMPPPGSFPGDEGARAATQDFSAGGSLLPALAWGRGAADVMLKSLATIGSLQLLTMLVHLVRAKSLAVILGWEWIGFMAVMERLLGIVERRHHFIDVDIRRRITLRGVGEKLDIARSRRETAVSLEGLLDREKSPVFWVR